MKIEDAPRAVGFPLQVKFLGLTHEGVYPERTCCYPDRLEVCLRLYSRAKEWINYIDGVRYVTSFPHVQIKYPGTPHRFTVETPLDTLHFAYPPEAVPRFRAVFPLPPPPIWEVELGKRESVLIAELTELRKHSHDYGVADRIDILSFELLELLIFQYHREAEHPDYHESKIRAVASYIQFHFREEINFDEIARYHSISRSTLERHWRRYFKAAPGEYLRDLRLREACRILSENPQMKIGEVSRALNFGDTAYFCALFKKRTGRTPIAWRKSRKNAGKPPA